MQRFSTAVSIVSLCSLACTALACSAGDAAPSPHGSAGSAGTMTAGGTTGVGGGANGGSATSGGSGGTGTGGGAGGSGGSSAGAAGTSSSGGSSGGDASGGSGGSSSGPGPCPADAFFCTGFEDAGIPAGASYQPTFKAADWAQHMAFQSMVVNSGAQALEVKKNNEYWATLSVPVPVPTFWVRLYMRSSEDWGQDGHNSFFFAMTGNGDQNGGDNVEVSEQFCQPVFNLHDDVVLSVGGTAACATPGIGPLAKDTWRCVEAFFDGTAGTYQVYADNQLIIDKTGWTQLAFATFGFGYVNFHGPDRTMWYDDLAIAPNRVGCP